MRSIKRRVIALVLAGLLASSQAALATGTAAWIAGNGQGLTYGTAGFTASCFNSLATGSGCVGSQIDNSTALDLYSDFSFVVTVGGTTTAGSYFGLYLLPLNQDGTTFGDGTASGSTAPQGSYLVGTVLVKSGVTTGNTVTGTVRGVLLPPGKFELAFWNQTGISMNAAAAWTGAYRTYNENLNR